MTELCARVLEWIGRHPAAVTIVFVGDREMQALNARHRRKDYATDVLSFTYPEEQVDGMCFLGEVVIAPRVAARNAREDGIGVEAELRKLIVHGLLHLAGYDHETDSGEMNRLQKRILDRTARERFSLVAGRPKNR